MIVTETRIQELKLLARGKVRDIYDLGSRLLLVATDRLSAFDVVFPNGIPRKGEVLTSLSRFWFRELSSIVPNHFVSSRVDDVPGLKDEHLGMLRGRVTLCRKAKPLPVECVVRGYLEGSGWREYRERGRIVDIELPKGLVQASRLPEPIFTPSTKATEGHDENIGFAAVVELVGKEMADRLRSASLALFNRAAEILEDKDIILADTKFEFGLIDGELILIDEVLTPDSSRFWPRSQYNPGGPQPSYDKQYVREYLETLDWDKTPPAPPLPEDVVRNTSEKYLKIHEIVTGESLD